MYTVSMSEKCNLRQAVELGYSGVSEPQLPLACISCMYKAISAGRAEVRVEDTSDEALKEMKEFYGDGFDSVEADKWSITSMSNPEDTAYREAHAEYGYDINTISYEGNSIYRTEVVTFDCDNDSIE